MHFLAINMVLSDLLQLRGVGVWLQLVKSAKIGQKHLNEIDFENFSIQIWHLF